MSVISNPCLKRSCAFAYFLLFSAGLLEVTLGASIGQEEILAQCYDSLTCSSNYGKAVFATTAPLFDRELTASLFPSIYDQGEDTQTCGLGSKFLFMDSCSQIHSPYTPLHETFGFEVTDVQDAFALKWNNVMDAKTEWKYDSFLDNSAAWFVDDLSDHYNTWMSLGAHVVILRWYADVGYEDVPFYSIITHNGRTEGITTLTQYELISDQFTLSNVNEEYLDFIVFVESESRAYFDEYTDYRSTLSDCDYYPIGNRRSVSNLDENVKFYQDLLYVSDEYDKPSVVTGEFIEWNGEIVKYAHIKFESNYKYSSSVSFFQRSDKSSFGSLSVLDFENGMNNAHVNAMANPFCGIDRWFDQHFALSLQSYMHAQLVIKKLSQTGLKYTVYGSPSVGDSPKNFVYVPEPNGQSIQLIFISLGVKWYATPTLWQDDWCPLECTDEQALYSFGDNVYELSEERMMVVNKDGLGVEGVKQAFGTSFVVVCLVVVALVSVFGLLSWNWFVGRGSSPAKADALTVDTPLLSGAKYSAQI